MKLHQVERIYGQVAALRMAGQTQLAEKLENGLIFKSQFTTPCKFEDRPIAVQNRLKEIAELETSAMEFLFNNRDLKT